ncbi:MAG: guanylate kinase [Clostridiales bacterium]|nr:guanylate kinase [Clostridiales bacterium]
MAKRGDLVVVSGFSGVGKGTVIKELMKSHPEYVFSVSGTTRYQRDGEVNGKDYFFMSREAFEEKVSAGGFLEYAEYSGNYYGTPSDYVFSQMDQGKNVILDIEYQGAFQVKERYPEAILFFLIPPSAEELYNRLLNRKTETMAQIIKRMETAVKETDHVHQYDTIWVNDKLEDTVNDFLAMHGNPELRIRRYEENMIKIPQIKKELLEILDKIKE